MNMITTFDQVKELLEEIDRHIATEPLLISRLAQIKELVKRARFGNEIDEFAFVISVSGELIYFKKCLISKKKLDYVSHKAMVSSGDQLELFMAYMHHGTDSEYWQNLKDAYIIQDYQFIPRDIIEELFSSSREKKEFLMDSDELRTFNNLPDPLTIYRGGSEDEEFSGYGISWSLKKEVAERFAEVKQIQTKMGMKVFELTIPKSEIIAYFMSRNEDEIIYIHPMQ